MNICIIVIKACRRFLKCSYCNVAGPSPQGKLSKTSKCSAQSDLNQTKKKSTFAAIVRVRIYRRPFKLAPYSLWDSTTYTSCSASRVFKDLYYSSAIIDNRLLPNCILLLTLFRLNKYAKYYSFYSCNFKHLN